MLPYALLSSVLKSLNLYQNILACELGHFSLRLVENLTFNGLVVEKTLIGRNERISNCSDVIVFHGLSEQRDLSIFWNYIRLGTVKNWNNYLEQ